MTDNNQPEQTLAPWEMSEEEFTVDMLDTPPYTREWHKERFAPFTQLALAHALNLPEEVWLDLRREASESTAEEWLPFITECSEHEIMNMTREAVIHDSGVWEGISADEYPGLFTGEVLGMLHGNPVVYSEYEAAYLWNEPERDELCTIYLRYPMECRL